MAHHRGKGICLGHPGIPGRHHSVDSRGGNMSKPNLSALRVCALFLMVTSVAFTLSAQQTGPLPPQTPPATADKQDNQSSQNSQNNQPAPPQSAPAPSTAGQAGTNPPPSTSVPSSDAPAAPSGSPVTPGAPSAPVEKIQVPAGTHLPLVLHNAVTTRSAKPGDPVYLETLFPIMADGHVVIPAGSYVSGEVTEAKRPGKVKGTGEIMIKLNTLILPNGYMVNLNAAPSGSAGTGGNESVDNEGKIKGDTDKTGDIGTVATTTATGAAIGGLASRTPVGAGIGAGIGAAAGLLAVLLTRGPEAELPRGTTLEAVLNRPIFLDADKVQFTSPGQASTLAGPPNREPVRTRERPF